MTDTINNDPVNHPAHYTQSLNEHGIECIQAIEASMSSDEFIGFLKGQVLKYLWRMNYKGHPVQDLGKARYYLNKLIDRVEKRQLNADAVQKAVEEQVGKMFATPGQMGQTGPVPVFDAVSNLSHDWVFGRGAEVDVKV